MNPSARAATVPVLALAAHLLAEAGSAVIHAGDVLELVAWPEDERPAVEEALSHAARTIQGLRMLLDAHTAQMTGRGAGGGESIAGALEIIRDEVAR